MANLNQFVTKYTVKAKFKVGGTGVSVSSNTFVDADVSIADDTIVIENHGYANGDVVSATTTGTLPTGLAVDTAYYVIVVDSSKIKLATSRANAFAGTDIDITGVTSGTHTLLKDSMGVILSGVRIPSGHIIVNSAYDVVTTCVSSGADAGTLAIHVNAANDIVSATAISTGTTWDNVTNMVAGTPVSAATAVKCTADREITFTIASNAFSAGEVNVYLDVIPSE